MQTGTIFLIQSTYQATPNMLNKLRQLHTPHDAVILMGDSVLYAGSALLQDIRPLYVLENEVDNLQSNLEDIKLISYDQFADLILQYTRSITFK